ncbi:hypothetical protein [Desulfonatronovibrio magnus]|uniref:hypothetical protein n=1 Tax=Desulfonatronovibrio magnus TaxID=698827 RepID=UPI0005EB310C|nr:hypothetical protein [Desulfonatronovibrio magnus]
MLIRIAPKMFSDPEYGAFTIPNVAKEFTGTQKFKSKYPWRSEYRAYVIPATSNAMQDDEYILLLKLVKQMIENGVVNEKTDRLFDLSAVDKEVVSYALSKGHAISTGDQDMIDFAAQEFSDDFKGNLSPLELIVAWLKKNLFEWDDSKHRVLEEWAITNERPQPPKAKSMFKKITGRSYPGP